MSCFQSSLCHVFLALSCRAEDKRSRATTRYQAGHAESRSYPVKIAVLRVLNVPLSALIMQHSMQQIPASFFPRQRALPNLAGGSFQGFFVYESKRGEGQNLGVPFSKCPWGIRQRGVYAKRTRQSAQNLNCNTRQCWGEKRWQRKSTPE